MPRGGNNNPGVKLAAKRLSQLFLEVGAGYMDGDKPAERTLGGVPSASSLAGKAAYLDFAWWLWKEDINVGKPGYIYFTRESRQLASFREHTDRKKCVDVLMRVCGKVQAHTTLGRALRGHGVARDFVLTLARYFTVRLGRTITYESLLSPEMLLTHEVDSSALIVEKCKIKECEDRMSQNSSMQPASDSSASRPKPRTFPGEMAQFLNDFGLDRNLSDAGRALLLSLGSKFEPFAIPKYCGASENLIKGFEILAYGGNGASYGSLLSQAKGAGVESILNLALFKVGLLSANSLYNEVKSLERERDWRQFYFSINVGKDLLASDAFFRLIRQMERPPYQVIFEASEDLRTDCDVDNLRKTLNQASGWSELAMDDVNAAVQDVRFAMRSYIKCAKVDRLYVERLYKRQLENEGSVMLKGLKRLRQKGKKFIVEGVSSPELKCYLHRIWDINKYGEIWMQGYHMQVPEPWTGVLRPLNSSDPETPEAYVLWADQVLTPAVESLNDGRCEQGISPISMGADEQTRFEARIQEAIVKVLIDERQENMVARLFGEHVSFKMDQVANALSAWWASRDALARIELFRERVELIAKGLKEPRSGQERSVFAGEATRILALLALACVDRKMAMLNRDVAGSVEQLNLQFGVSIEVYRFGRDDIEDLKPVIRRVDDNNDWVGKGEPEWTGGGGVNKTLLPELGPLEASEYVIKLQKNLFLDLHPNQRTFEDFNLTAVQLDYLNDRLSKEGRYVALHDLQMQKEGSPLLDEGVWARFKEDLPDVPVFRFGVVKVGERSVFLVKEGRLLGAIARFMEMIERYE